ncbi:MAG: MBL fold metallo-hydrolase [Phycisphaeraceae bacterium]|nr:MBL fold metallo-hydrolase [Phycisphaeraceae bacterium]
MVHTPGGAPSSHAPPAVRGWALGPFETNCYVVAAAGTTDCWIIDPGLGPGEVIDAVRRDGLGPVAIILTHAHLDHVAGVPEVLRAFPGVQIIGHETERDWPGDPELNLSGGYGFPISVPGATKFVADGDSLRIGADNWRVIHTPGHSPGGITLYNPAAGVAIVGDTLFAGSIGRSDFPGSDEATLHSSIRERLYTLPDTTRVLPGHGPETTIGREKRANPFVRP